MDALKQARLQEFRAELAAELVRRGWESSEVGFVHPDHGLIENDDLLWLVGNVVSEEADDLENAAKQLHDEMLEDPDDQHDPLEEFRATLEDRGLTPLDVFAAVLGDEQTAAKISAVIEILGCLDRDKLGASFGPACGGILTVLAEMLADPSQKS